MKSPPSEPASHLGTDSCSCWSTSNLPPFNILGKSAEDGPTIYTLATHMGNLGKALTSTCPAWHCSHLGNESSEGRSLRSLSHSPCLSLLLHNFDFQINSKYVFNETLRGDPGDFSVNKEQILIQCLCNAFSLHINAEYLKYINLET